MPVEDVFPSRASTVAAGRVERGTVKLSETVQIVGLKEETRDVVVTGVEMFRKLLDQAIAGDNIGLLLRGVQRNEIREDRCWPNRLHQTPPELFFGGVRADQGRRRTSHALL